MSRDQVGALLQELGAILLVPGLGYETGVRPLLASPGHQVALDTALQNLIETSAEQLDIAYAGLFLHGYDHPTLHLEEFVGGISQKAWQGMLDNPLHPLVNKLVQGQYPPGSTYKPVTAFAGLAEGVITADTSFFCPGSYRFGNRTYRCWKRGGHGTVSLRRAVAESCDVYFYQVGQRLGVDRLARYARMFGLGEKSGVEMEHEKPGLIPTAAWKKSKRGQAWQEGETLSIAIGQGYDLATPLQIAEMTAVIANGGTLYKPSVIEKVVDPDGRVTVDMGAPVFDHVRVPFDGSGLTPDRTLTWERWPLPLAGAESAPVAVVSMGNPHAVLLVDDVLTTGATMSAAAAALLAAGAASVSAYCLARVS